MYKKMNIDQIGSDQEQVNNWWINIDQLFDEISREIHSIKHNEDGNEQNDVEQIEHLSLSIDNLNLLIDSIQNKADYETWLNRLREEFEQLRSKKNDLDKLKAQVVQQSTITKLDLKDYIIPEVDPWQGRSNSISIVKAQEQWPIAWFFAKIFAPLNPEKNKISA
jgi:hypothetical protein